MKKLLFIGCVFVLLINGFALQGGSKTGPSLYLDMDQTLRVDIILSGNDSEQKAVLFRLSRDQGWSGSANQLVSPFDYGEYRFFLIHPPTVDTLFSRGFSSLFEEWRTTDEAKQKTKAFQQTLVMPAPRQTAILVLEGRNWDQSFSRLMEETINPNELELFKSVKSKNYVRTILGDDLPQKRVDLLIMAEGYGLHEMDKFLSDARRITNSLFSVEPFKSNKASFTVRTLAIPSPQSGVTDPLTGTWKNTYFNSRFNTFDIDRYLQSKDVWRIYETAAMTSYDHIILLVNSRKYGGGGVYNHFSITTSDHEVSGALLIHELGHGFAGLGDEYFESDVSYTQYINLKTEPWQPNLTTLVNFDRKWKALLDPVTPVPTPDRPPFENTIGAFEGGGYVSKGVYRPEINCFMRSGKTGRFCGVCQQTITQMIHFYTR
jgi:hypothetical protein